MLEQLFPSSRRPVSFRGAAALSLLIHIFAFLLAAFIVELSLRSHPGTSPLVFELVLGNSREHENRDAQPRANSAGPPAPPLQRVTSQKNNTPPDQSETPMTPGEEADPASAPNTAEEASDNLEEVGVESIIPQTSPLQPFSSLLPRLPAGNVETPEIIPLKLSISPSQRKAVLKKVRQIISRPIPPAALDSSFTWEKDGQRFQFELSHQLATSATALDELFITINTVEGGDTLTTRLRMRRMAFSHFAQFVDYWNPYVAVHDDEFDGRFHSNSTINISGSGEKQPKFHGKVTTADYRLSNREVWPFLDSEEIFLGGIETGADPIPLPKVFLGLPSDTSRADGRIKKFSEETWITFHRDGTYSWRASSTLENEHREKLSSEPNCIIGRGKAKLHVKGVLNGTLIVYSENKIIIDDDLFYAQDPEAFSVADDFLGLVSRKDIEIAPPEVTGPGDLRIYAAILAKGRFRVPHIFTRHKGTMYVYGSISAGSISATEPRYATRTRFDKRFEKIRPPHFPMTNRFEITDWDQRWKVRP
jgi:hypothetical protein